MAMTFWGWEELPDDVLMKDACFYGVMRDIINRDFTRKELIDICDYHAKGMMRLQDVSALSKQIALHVWQNDQIALCVDEGIYYWNRVLGKNSVIQPTDVDYFRKLGIELDSTEDEELLTYIEEERLSNREENWDELEKLDYWDE